MNKFYKMLNPQKRHKKQTCLSLWLVSGVKFLINDTSIVLTAANEKDKTSLDIKVEILEKEIFTTFTLRPEDYLDLRPLGLLAVVRVAECDMNNNFLRFYVSFISLDKKASLIISN